MNALDGKIILISAGGTGGHVYPALSVANKLKNMGATIHWIGTDAGIESRLVPENDIELHKIFIQGVRKNGIIRLLKTPFVLLRAVLAAKTIFNKVKPDIYIGFGGFVSGPAAVAAKLLSVPVILHEQNAAMGLTNKIVNIWAKKLLLAFPIVGINSEKMKVIGNPVRETISSLPVPSDRILKSENIRVLIVGGSLGAKILNEIVPPAIKKLEDKIPNLQIKHQTGKLTYDTAIKNYKLNNINSIINIDIVPYIENMNIAYSNADIVICRAGALTVSEIASVGIAAIFVPLPFAVDNHQYLNAKFLVDNDAAIIIEQKEFTAEKLANTMKDLIKNNKLLLMAEKSREKSHINALPNIVKQIVEVLNVSK